MTGMDDGDKNRGEEFLHDLVIFVDDREIGNEKEIPRFAKSEFHVNLAAENSERKMNEWIKRGEITLACKAIFPRCAPAICLAPHHNPLP